MKRLMDFLADLRENNNKPWFDSNKERYKEALAVYNSFAEEFIAAIARFDSDAAVLSLKDCTYRIYRDQRFSKDKGPYKHTLGVYVCRGGKKTEYAGYYIHFEPPGEGGGGSFMSCGIYMPAPFVLRSVREEILDNGKEIDKAIKNARGFRLNTDNRLKRNPVGFPEGHEFDHYLRQRDFFIEKPFDLEYITAPGLAERAAEDFRKTYPLACILNRAVEYAYEENV
ncbi:MAG: DUF2461 domain-containing protein [Alistipes sp.]|nr:DUF2461 domain-containing protein [Alistipes sp.]